MRKKFPKYTGYSNQCRPVLIHVAFVTLFGDQNNNTTCSIIRIHTIIKQFNNLQSKSAITSFLAINSSGINKSIPAFLMYFSLPIARIAGSLLFEFTGSSISACRDTYLTSILKLITSVFRLPAEILVYLNIT